MNITQFAIQQNRITFVLVTLLTIAGLLAYQSLPKAQDPGFTIRTAVITTQFPGANPERVELLVSDKIEKKVQEMPEVDFITSENRTGISIVSVNFRESIKNMRPVFDDLRRKIEDVKGDLPNGIRDPIVNDEFGDVFGSVYILKGDGIEYAKLKNIADDIRDRLLKEPEISKVNIHGSQDEVIFVEYNNARLTELGLSPQQLSNILANVNILSSGGNILSGKERIALEPSGNFESVADLRSTIVQLPSASEGSSSPRLVSLGDIATIYRGYVDPPESLSRANGEPAMAVAIALREGGNILALGERLNEIIPLIEAEYPLGVSLEKIWFQADLVEKNVDDFLVNLLQAVAIVILVMVVTLGFRTGFLVASLIPMTMIITFFIMQQFSITVNQISLAALIIALGLLVDNAIVMVESVLVKREQGINALQAAILSGQEMLLPLLVSSLTTAAAFMPIALAESAVGEYTADIFYVVGIALLTSWVLAMTFIPLLTIPLLKIKAQATEALEGFDGIMYRIYRPMIEWSLKHKLMFFILIFGLFYSAIFAFRFVPQIFIAPSQDPVFTGKLELPLGTAVETSQKVISDVDRYIKAEFYDPQCTGIDAQGNQRSHQLKNWLMFIGEGGPRMSLGLDPPNPNPANSFMVANTCKGGDVESVIASIEKYVAEKHPDLQVQLKRLSNGPPVSYPISLRLSGADYQVLYGLSDKITDFLYEDPDVLSVKNTWGLLSKKLAVTIDQDRAQRAGVTNNDVAYSLNANLSGVELTQFRDGDKLIPVKVRTVATDRNDIDKLDGMSVYSQTTGKSVPLKQVADISLQYEPGVILRRDKERSMTLNVQLKAGVTATEVNARLRPWLNELQQKRDVWPSSYQLFEGGESESSGDANAAIGAKLPIALMIIVMLLVIQFNSVRRPIIILSTIPLGIIGVAYGLLIAQSSFGFFTILGIIALSGIIINNAIVLLDRISIEINELGKPPRLAIVDACQQRLRPIILTTATTSGGMLPLWLSGNPMFQPMAVTIIFGLIFATFLTLLFVPVLYALFFKVKG